MSFAGVWYNTWLVQPLSSGLYRRYRILTDSAFETKARGLVGACPITAGVEFHHPLKLMQLYYIFMWGAIRKDKKWAADRQGVRLAAVSISAATLVAFIIPHPYDLSWWSIGDFYAALRIPTTNKIHALTFWILKSPVSHPCGFLIPFHFSKIKRKAVPSLLFWWSIGDSNPWPQHCERCALPTVLMPHSTK